MKKTIILVVTALAAVACDLNRLPISEVAADAYGKDTQSVENLLIGTYNALYDVAYNEWAVTELRSDNVRMRVNASTAQDTKEIMQLDNGTILSGNSFVGNYWDAAYRVINRANSVLAHLDVVEDPATHASFEGEALFLRAWMHFNIVRLWGPAFIVTHQLSADEARHMQRSSVDEVYAQIEEDLEKVVDEELLPLERKGAQLGRADLRAAKVMLAKVYVTHYKISDEQYSRAKALLSEVMTACGNPASGNELVPFDRVFATDNEMNKEIIFAIRYRSGKLGIGSPFTTLYAPINNGGNVAIGSPKHYNFPSDNLIAAFNDNGTDLRKDVTLQESYFNKTTGQVVNARYCNKFIDPAMASEWDAENDFPVIRLADVMLLLAEVSNELAGPSAESLVLLNAVRERAGIEAYTLGELASKYAFREAVRKERRVELALENQYWFDLLRWGTAVSRVNEFFRIEPFFSAYDFTVNPIEEWQTMLPIPQSVKNVNSEVAQNPGY